MIKLSVWVLSISGLVSLVASFAVPRNIPCQRSTRPGPSTTASTLTPTDLSSVARGRCVPLQLAARDGEEEDDADTKAMGKPGYKTFGQTSGAVKAFVGGLTDAFVMLGGMRRDSAPIDSSVVKDSSPSKAALSVEELEAGIRNEYVKNYLWTGGINEALYEEDCSFTDPTLSFSGLSTYKRNVGSLQGVLDKLVTNSRSILYSCQLEQEDSCVQTRWRMVGDIRLPWGPRIDVVGRTTFSYDSGRGNRIFSYDEVWEMEPAEALMQLFRPAGKEVDGDTLVLPQEEE